MQHNDMIVGMQIALTLKTDALLNLQVSAHWTLMKEPSSFLGSSLNGAAAAEKKHSFITHLLKDNHYEIAVMPPEQRMSEVLMERSAFVARQNSTLELGSLSPRTRRSPAVDILSKPRRPSVGKPRGVLSFTGRRWRGVGDGEGDGISQVSDQRSKRGECRRSSRPSPASSWRRRVNSWTTWPRSTAGSLRSCKAQQEGKSVAPFWLQTSPCPCTGLRELAERITFSNTIVLCLRQLRHQISGRRVSEKSVIRNSLCCQIWLKILHVRFLCFLEPRKKNRDTEGQFVDVETVTNNTLTKPIDQFEQMVIALEQWRQTLAEGTSEPSPFRMMSSRSISRSSRRSTR